MIILTGGAGFIGSNLLGALNASGVTDVLVVDRVGDSSRNLKDLRFSDFMRPEEFARAIERRDSSEPNRSDLSSRCVRRHHLHRWPLHDREQFYVFEIDFAFRSRQQDSIGVRVERRGLWLVERIRTVARERTPAQPVRLVQTRLRQPRPQRCGQSRRALSPVSDISTSTVRASLTKAKWRRWCISCINS